MENTRGSIWRKWDLHVHTPFSYLNNEFDNDWDIYVQTLFREAIKNDIHAIGITDYFTIDGYKKIKTDYLEQHTKLNTLFTSDELGKIKQILILPNIEFRLNKLVGKNRINFHVIFSNEVSIQDIEENFLHEIDFTYEGAPQSDDKSHKLKVRNLETLGERLINEHQHFKDEGKSPLFIGMMCAVVDDKQINSILNSKPDSVFKGNYLLALPCDEDLSKVSWDGQDHQARKVLIQKSDFFIANNPKTIQWGLGNFNKSVDEFVNEFKSIKPCISGSDAHSYKELFVKNGQRKFWVKADLTFEGLKQILNEHSRVYIGEEPAIIKHVRENPTKYIDYLQIKKVDNPRTEDEWFDNIHVEINPELTAIIGNKGKGKSALSDIMGLCGNSHNYEYFSFLNSDKFKKAQPINLSKDFNGNLSWISGNNDTKNLNDIPNGSSYEKIKYIPQNFLEKLCTDINKKVFEDELEKVIFSRLDEAEKLGRSTLKEIINYKREVIDSSLSQKKAILSKINSQIVEMEYKKSDFFLKSINENIEQKLSEYNAHLAIQPIEKMPPEESEEQRLVSLEMNDKIVELRNSFEKLNEQKSEVINEKTSLLLELSELQKLKQSFEQLSETIEGVILNNTEMLAKYSLIQSEIISYQISTIAIDNLIITKQDRVTEINLLLSATNPNGLPSLINQNAQDIVDIQKDLDGPNKIYQEYLTALTNWKTQETNIKGYESKEGSLDYYKSTKKYVEEKLPADIEAKYGERQNVFLEILKLKHDIIEIYKELYEPVTSFIELNKNEISDYNVNIDVKLQLKSFDDKFFNIVSNGAAGSFCGITEARILLNKLIQNCDFNSDKSISDLVNAINLYCHVDKREGFKDIKRDLKRQLKSGFTEENFYDFLFDLDYLEPSYQLRLGEKVLSELSPGERGALLLIFYLLLDKNTIPLIIDQPEENLDNQSVYKILVPFVKKAKERRQIIIVTHNPNLAVVCDADQIIRTDIDKSNKNLFSFKSGAIENEIINEEIIDVLEGTRPALDNRTSKYDMFKH